MMADWFIAGIGGKAEELSDEQRETMIEQAMAFLESGGQISWDQWATLSDETRIAFRGAAARVQQVKSRLLAAEIVELIVGYLPGTRT